MMAALIGGWTNPKALAQLARIDALDADIAALDATIEEMVAPFRFAVEKLDEIPGSAPPGRSQRQRLAIARATIRNAQILLLDEPTTGLDAASAERIPAPMRRLMTGRTTLVISHNLLTVTEADQILFLADGRITGAGTHSELPATNPGYEPPSSAYPNTSTLSRCQIQLARPGTKTRARRRPPADVADIIDACLHRNPIQRPTLERLAAALATLTAQPAPPPGNGPARNGSAGSPPESATNPPLR